MSDSLLILFRQMLCVELLMELELPLGQLLFAQVYISLPQPKVCIGNIRSEPERLLILRYGRVVLVPLGIEIGKLEMGIRERRVERDGFLQLRLNLIEVRRGSFRPPSLPKADRVIVSGQWRLGGAVPHSGGRTRPPGRPSAGACSYALLKK